MSLTTEPSLQPHNFIFSQQLIKIPLCIYAHTFITHSSVDGHLDWFHFLAIVKRAAINMAMQISLWQVTESFGHMPGIV